MSIEVKAVRILIKVSLQKPIIFSFFRGQHIGRENKLVFVAAAAQIILVQALKSLFKLGFPVFLLASVIKVVDRRINVAE